MSRKKIYRNYLIAALMVNIIFIGVSLTEMYKDRLPNNIKIMVGKESFFDFNVPASAVIRAETSEEVMQVSQVNLKEPFTLHSSQKGSYVCDVKLFNLIQLKQMKVDVIEKKKVIPCGNPIGIYIQTNGLLVLDTQSVTGADGVSYEPCKNILAAGDYIQKVNGKTVKDKETFVKMVDQQGDEPMVLTVARENKTREIKVTPVEVKKDQSYKLGVWVRDNTQGIGTLTYMDGSHFGALGHGIHDVDTGTMMDVNGGYIFDSKILSLVKGKSGKPGEMVGIVCYDFEHPFGTIQKNTSYGIYGTMNMDIDSKIKKEAVEIGLKQEVKKGKAYIRSGIDGTTKDYEIRIESVDVTNKNVSKGMVIRITDERLLSQTNGIIQGMSGTPILQNGKLIGAVTHVFVQDSTKGYGTFIENMLKQAKEG